LDFCRAHPQIVTAIGKLRAVPADDLVRHARATRSVQVEEAEDVDTLLASVGRRRG
jgi:hypothetical protein